MLPAYTLAGLNWSRKLMHITYWNTCNMLWSHKLQTQLVYQSIETFTYQVVPLVYRPGDGYGILCTSAESGPHGNWFHVLHDVSRISQWVFFCIFIPLLSKCSKRPTIPYLGDIGCTPDVRQIQLYSPVEWIPVSVIGLEGAVHLYWTRGCMMPGLAH